MQNFHKVILVDIVDPKLNKSETTRRLKEMESLIHTFGGLVILKVFQKRQVPDYHTYIGFGKLEKVIEECEKLKPNLLIINNILKPSQVFNIETKLRKKVDLRVWDRIDLILKIFEKHASTKEAKLEIELAKIKHMGPRVFGMGLELSRQGGGIGTSGIGETNIEIMRRHLKDREKKIINKLKKCENRKKINLETRKKNNYKAVALAGYTNAGKSSLLNLLTNKNVTEKNSLFTTLDTRVGKLFLPNKNTSVLLSDTIGFISNLPPKLINSFSSTLEESLNADLILHVIDISDEDYLKKIKTVNNILRQLSILSKPCVYVFNKIDLVKKLPKERIMNLFADFCPVFVSAHSKSDKKLLIKVIEDNLFKKEEYDKIK
jgi:GTP-binding protein HflX